jgi:hypothetical protein
VIQVGCHPGDSTARAACAIAVFAATAGRRAG